MVCQAKLTADIVWLVARGFGYSFAPSKYSSGECGQCGTGCDAACVYVCDWRDFFFCICEEIAVGLGACISVVCRGYGGLYRERRGTDVTRESSRSYAPHNSFQLEADVGW